MRRVAVVTGGDAALAAVAVLAGATAQGATGIGFSLVAVPILVVALGPADAVRTANLVSIGVNGIVLAIGRRHLDLRAAAGLFVPAAIAAVPAGWLVRHGDTDVLSVVVGTVIVGAVTALAAGLRSDALRGRAGATVAGAMSGAMNTLGGVSGPVAAIYAVNAGWSPEVLRPTLQAYFIAVYIASLVAIGLPHVPGATIAGLFATVPVGLAVGHGLGVRFGPATVRRGVLVLAAAGGVVAVVRGVV
jgi:uncharacterized membrane protein YfcA